VTPSEQINCRKIGFRCGAKAQQVEHEHEHEHDDEHEHESPKFGNWVKDMPESYFYRFL
jgi:hypothetical protein